MDSKLMIEIQEYLENRYIQVCDTLNSQYLNMIAKRQGMLFDLFNKNLIDEKTKLSELIRKIEECEVHVL